MSAGCPDALPEKRNRQRIQTSSLSLFSDRFFGVQLSDLLRAVEQDFRQHLVGMLTEQRSALHFNLQLRELDRATERHVLAATLLVNFHHRAALTQRHVLVEF